MTAKEIIHEAAWCVQFFLVRGYTYSEIAGLTGVNAETLQQIRKDAQAISLAALEKLFEASGKELVVRDKEEKHG